MIRWFGFLWPGDDHGHLSEWSLRYWLLRADRER
jgi:hypothetical protein